MFNVGEQIQVSSNVLITKLCQYLRKYSKKRNICQKINHCDGIRL